MIIELDKGTVTVIWSNPPFKIELWIESNWKSTCRKSDKTQCV